MAAEDPLKLIGTVARVCKLIQYLGDCDAEASITAISRSLNLPVSTVHRLLHLLMEQGFVERGVRFQSYRVGGELYRVGNIVSKKMVLSEIAQPIMEAVAEATGEFTMLGLYLQSDRSLTLIRTVASKNPLTYRADTFVHISIAWGASGRAILAHLPAPEIQQIHATAGPSPVTGEALPPLKEFRNELEAIRRRGYARTHNQKVSGAVGLGSAIFGRSGNAIASLCLTIPDFRFDAVLEPSYGALLREKAAALSHAAGYVPDARNRFYGQL